MSNRYTRTAARAAVFCLLLLACLSPHSVPAQQQEPWQTNIVKIGHIPLSGYAIDVAVGNNRAYVLTRRGPSASVLVPGQETWISVIDISNPARPHLLSVRPVGDRRERIFMDRNRAIVFGGSDGMDLIDFDNNSFYAMESNGAVDSAVIDGNFLYALENSFGNQVRIYDITDAGTPVFQGAIGAIGRGHVAARDGFVFYRDVNKFPDMLFTYDATNPANPVFLAGFPLPTPAITNGVLVVQGRRAYSLNNNSDHLEILDIGDPNAVYVFPPIYVNPQDVAPLHAMAYVASENEILAIDADDLFDGEHLLGKIELPDRALGVDTYGSYCVAACGFQGLHIVNYTGLGALVRFNLPVSGKYARDTQLLVRFTTAGEAGTAPRLELWQGRQRIKTLGIVWHPQGTHQLSIPLGSVIPPGDGYFLRAVSTWNPSIFGDSPEFDVLP